MSNSSLSTYKNVSANKTSPRKGTIDTVSIHCVVGQWTAKQTVDFLQPSSRNASCNYAVGKDGSIAIGVDEKDRSWCTSSSSNDHRAITIEVASDTKDPYKVTDAAYQALVKLLADICKRNPALSGGLKWKGDKGLIGQVSKQNMTVHRWFSAKACPGDYLYGLHGKIASDVNALLSGNEVIATSTSKTATKTTSASTSTSSSTTKDAWISKLQSACNEAGYSNQKVDGIAGPVTLAGCPTLKVGANSSIVGLLQEQLIILGYALPKYGVDKDFGNETKSAVKAFQQAESLAVDGIVGKNTWSVLLGLR